MVFLVFLKLKLERCEENEKGVVASWDVLKEAATASSHA